MVMPKWRTAFKAILFNQYMLGFISVLLRGRAVGKARRTNCAFFFLINAPNKPRLSQFTTLTCSPYRLHQRRVTFHIILINQLLFSYWRYTFNIRPHINHRLTSCWRGRYRCSGGYINQCCVSFDVAILFLFGRGCRVDMTSYILNHVPPCICYGTFYSSAEKVTEW